MSKKKKNRTANPVANTISKTSAQKKPRTFAFDQFRVQAIILALICLVFYFNSFDNTYALDDGLVITQNEYVQNGFEGIPNILRSDAYESYYKQMNGNAALSGGRYRPLSIVTFAIEQQLFGKTGNYTGTAQSGNQTVDTSLAHTRHVINVLLYILTVIVLLHLLRYIIFPSQPLIAFLAALLFAVHPIHTEVVANIKSRDEIFSLLFICLTLIYSWKYNETNKIKHLVIALSTFFLALLSKEYAVTLLVIIPLLFYVFKSQSLVSSVKKALPFLAVFAVYVLVRFSIVPLKSDVPNTEVMNDPYLYATASQKIATIIATQLNYIKLLFFPYPLCSDYGYNQIPYTNFSNAIVWLSFLVYASLFALLFILLKKRHPLSFALAFFLLNWLLISNLIFNIGATMGERLVFHSSVGFAIIIAYLLYAIYQKINKGARKSLAIVCLIIIIVLCGFDTIQRNADWKDNITLYSKDIQTSPNSVALNASMGTNCAMLSDTYPTSDTRGDDLLKQAISYWSRALEIHHTYVLCYVNRASAYLRFGQYELALHDLDSINKYYPAFPTLHNLYATSYFKNGVRNYGRNGDYEHAITELQKAAREDPNDPKTWYFMGNYFAALKQYDKSLNALGRAMQLSPNDPPLQKFYDSVRRMTDHN